MEIKRLRKSKTLKTEETDILAEIAAIKTADAVRRQQLETMKIPDSFGEECRNLNSCGYEIMRISRNLSCYFSAIGGTAKIETKKMDLCEFLKFLCEKASPYAEKADIRILYKMPKERIIADIDKDNISYAVYDIMLNAMEHSPAKSKIKITLQKLQKFAKITVEDKGEGMDEETLCHCAEPLFRGEKPSGEKGMGLGLSLAEYYIHLNGGRVKVLSEKGKGTTVSVFLPFGNNDEDFIAAEDFEILSGEGRYIPAAVVFSGIGKREE